MKSFILACVAAIAAAETKEGTAVDIPEASNNGVRSAGQVKEVMTDDGSLQTITVTMGWETEGDKWDDKAWVQNFAQWPDPANVGEYIGVTCNAQYIRGDAYSYNVSVDTMAGESLSNSDADGGRNWEEYGVLSPRALFQKDEVTKE